ncbi:class I SAM-dependent methyltransferase [Archangium sp.]|uniref:class I SAM-dependent methyltransferase n=1 Tax=Archangium sp. TaxID=1872627 RepID=UPI002EDB2108
MSYILDNKSEFERLEMQAALKGFDYPADLEGFPVPDGGNVLDAGCGSGVAVRELARRHPRSTVIGCDMSAERVALAAEAAKALPNARFEVQDVRALSYPPDRFDAIFCRYVLSHLDADGRRRAVDSMRRCLKPGGVLRLVEPDGLFSGVYPMPDPLPELYAALTKSGVLELYMGRKLPELLLAAGFEAVETRISVIHFPPEEREAAIQMLSASNTLPLFTRMLGSEEKARAAQQAQAEVLRRPDGVRFYNKFTVTARGPR